MAYTKRQAGWARVVCALFVLALFLTLALTINHGGHTHEHPEPEDDCVICCLLQATAKLRLGALGLATAAATVWAFRLVRRLAAAAATLRGQTPVLLAVRIDS